MKFQEEVIDFEQHLFFKFYESIHIAQFTNCVYLNFFLCWHERINILKKGTSEIDIFWLHYQGAIWKTSKKERQRRDPNLPTMILKPKCDNPAIPVTGMCLCKAISETSLGRIGAHHFKTFCNQLLPSILLWYYQPVSLVLCLLGTLKPPFSSLPAFHFGNNDGTWKVHIVPLFSLAFSLFPVTETLCWELNKTFYFFFLFVYSILCLSY